MKIKVVYQIKESDSFYQEKVETSTTDLIDACNEAFKRVKENTPQAINLTGEAI